MNYIEWAKEYYRDAQNVKQILDRLKTERKLCKGKDMKEYNRRIETLQAMYKDCRETGELLYQKGLKDGEAVA
ncbi:MAG TPA: hypothetical protein GX401_05865 [Clostridiales bacterium]|nr:hypothetical protein [Clostridiales bacterium]